VWKIFFSLGLNDILEVQRSFTNPRYEEFSSLCGSLKCWCIYTQRESPLDTEGRNLVKLQMKSPCKTSVPAKKYKVNHKNLIHSKSKQLHFSVA